MHDDACVALDRRLDLDLPLVGHRVVSAEDPVQQRVRRGRGSELLPVRAVVGEAVTAFGGADDRAALRDDLRGGRHALHGLVEVLVERVAGVRGDDDVVARRERAHRHAFRGARRRRRASANSSPPKACTIRCSPSRMTSREKSTPVAAAMARTSSWIGLPSVIPQRAGGARCARASWSVRTVSSPARPGATIFGPPREAGEEVRLDEAGRDPDVGLDPAPVQPDRDVGAEAPTQTSDASSRASWLTTPTAASTSSPNIAAQLLRGVPAMGAGGDEHDDVLETDDAVELLQDRRDDDLARLGPGAVAGADRDRLARV